MVALTYYAFDYHDLTQTTVFPLLNNVLTTVGAAFNVKIADGYGAFKNASANFGGDACAAGLLLPGTAAGHCDVHPSAAGQKLLAQAVVAALGDGKGNDSEKNDDQD